MKAESGKLKVSQADSPSTV